MNKKANTLLFVLGATVFNVLITIICFILLFVGFTQILASSLTETMLQWGLPVIFVLSIVASVLIYRAVIKQLMKKIDIEKYFDPIFPQRKRTINR